MKKLSFLLILSMGLACLHAQNNSISDISFSRHNINLKGRFFLSEGTGPFTTVILLPGFPGNQSDVLGLGQILSLQKINVLTFNYCGTYQSEGEFSFENAQKDIDAALNFLKAQENITNYRIDTTRIHLGGWCFGGGMAMAYASRHPEINSVFSIAGNDHGEFLRQYNANPEMKNMVDNMFDDLCKAGGIARIKEGELPKDLAEDITEKLDDAFDFKKIAPLLAQKEVLLIGAWDDKQVPFDLIVFPFYKELKKEHSKKVQLIGFQDDHYFRNTKTELSSAIIDWLNTLPGK